MKVILSLDNEMCGAHMRRQDISPTRRAQEAQMADSVQRKRRKNAATIVNPRIGALSPEQFEAIGKEALGGRGWQRALAHGTGWSPSTITRYLQGALPVPQHVAVLLECLVTMRRHGLPLPDAFLYEAAEDEEGDRSAVYSASPMSRSYLGGVDERFLARRDA
jgi:hypothetical protein